MSSEIKDMSFFSPNACNQAWWKQHCRVCTLGDLLVEAAILACDNTQVSLDQEPSWLFGLSGHLPCPKSYLRQYLLTFLLSLSPESMVGVSIQQHQTLNGKLWHWIAATSLKGSCDGGRLDDAGMSLPLCAAV